MHEQSHATPSEIPFYDDLPNWYQSQTTSYVESAPCDLENPSSIYDWLLTKIYKQDRYCETASMIFFNQQRRLVWQQ